MKKHRFWTLAALAALLSLPTVVSAQEPTEPDEAENAEMTSAFDVPATIRVANHNWQDVHVYVSRDGGALESLGMVTSQSTATFEMPRGFVASGSGVRVIADPVGSRQVYVSPDMPALPGSVVAVTIENAINLSSTSLRTQMNGS
jgi:hypothetical protein